MIDAGSFTEWILAKAEKEHGVVSSDAKNIEQVRGIVEMALLMDEEEVHVECTLAGRSGPVQIEERLTRSALEVLFAQVHVPAHRSTVREKVAQSEAQLVEPPPDSWSARQKARDARIARNVFIVVGLVFAGIIGSCITWAIEHDHHRNEPHDSHDKREMHRSP